MKAFVTDGSVTLEAVEKQKLFERVNMLSSYLVKRLETLQRRAPIIAEVRGRGFMIGIELSVDGRPIVDRCREQRLLLNCTQEKVLRLLPAMTITKAQLERALSIFEGVLVKQSP